MLKQISLCLIIGIICLIIPRIIHHIQVMNYGRVIPYHAPGPCSVIPGIVNGSEDMQALSNGLVFITSGLRYQKDLSQSPWNDIKGYIYLYDINNKDKPAKQLRIEGNLDSGAFNPHGLSLWKTADLVSLFVVNHHPKRECIERFTFDMKKPDVLRHEETITSEKMTYLNDVLAVGPRQVYYTNCVQYHDNTLAKLEIDLLLSLGSVGYYDAESGSSEIMVSGLSYPNGINVSPDGRFIYIAHFLKEEILVYERNKEDNTLELKQTKYYDSSVDNIEVDPVTHDLWTGNHPILYQHINQHGNPNGQCPSQVFRIRTQNGLLTDDVTDVYSEDGSRYISGSSSALRYKNYLLIGTVMQKALICEIKYID